MIKEFLSLEFYIKFQKKFLVVINFTGILYLNIWKNIKRLIILIFLIFCEGFKKYLYHFIIY